jgi:L-asparaginase
MPVVLTSLTGAGPVLTRTYGYPGSETDLLARGLIGVGLLGAYEARVLLRVLLSSGADRAATTDTFGRLSGEATERRIGHRDGDRNVQNIGGR